MSSGQMRVLADALILEALLSEPKAGLRKNASFIGDFGSMVKNYFASQIDKDNPVASVVILLAPGILSASLSAIGFGKLGYFLGLLIRVFHVKISEFLGPLCSEVKEIISGGKKMTSGQISEIADRAAQQYVGSESNAEDKVYTSADLIHHAKILKLALLDFEYQNMRLMKNDFDFSQSNLYKIAGRTEVQLKSVTLLAKIFSFIISIILSSAGLLVAGDIVNTMLGEHPFEGGSGSTTPAGPVTTQTKFQPKPGSPLIRNVNMTNTPQNVDSMLVQFAKDTYSGLDDKDNAIMATPGFQAVKNRIVWFNGDHPNSSIITIPPDYTSKKQIVDNFIDEVAKNS